MGLWYLVRGAYNPLVIYSGAHLMHHVVEGAPPAEEMIFREGDKYYFISGLVDQRGRFRRHLLPAEEIYSIHWNLILLATLLIMTPVRTVARRWFLALPALLILGATHAAYFALNSCVLVAKLYDSIGQPFWSADTVDLLDKTARFYSIVFVGVVPFLLYAPVLIFRPRARPTTTHTG